MLELAAQTARAEGAAIAERHVEDAARKRPLVYDKDGDAHYDFTSAFIKSMRGSDPDAALYYLAAMLEAGEDPALHRPADGHLRLRGRRQRRPAGAARRRRRGRTRSSTSACPRHASTWRRRRSTSHRAPKSNAVIKAIGAAARDVREHGALRPPKQLRDAHYPGARKLGHGEGYVYPHDDPRGFEVDHLPEELPGTTYYHPSGERGGAPAVASEDARAERAARSAPRQVAPSRFS